MKTVKMALVGAGTWAAAHAEVYATHPAAELVAVCDLDVKRARKLAKAYGARAYADVEGMLAGADVDAAAVVTPDFAHGAPCVAAARAGKHVLVEKPLATTRTDALAVCRAAKRARVQVMVDFHNRWNPPVWKIKEDIEEGKIGKVVSAYCRLNDVIWVPLEMLPWAGKSSILWFLGSHSVDTLSWLIGDRVKRVYAVSRKGILEKKGVDVPDLYQSTLEFSRGAVAQVESSWIIPNTNPYVNDYKLNVTGEKGMFNMDFSHNQLLERFLEDKADHPDFLCKPHVQGKATGLAYDSIRDFVDCIANGEPVKVPLQDSLNVTMTILAIMKSARLRRPVAVEHIRLKDL